MRASVPTFVAPSAGKTDTTLAGVVSTESPVVNPKTYSRGQRVSPPPPPPPPEMRLQIMSQNPRDWPRLGLGQQCEAYAFCRRIHVVEISSPGQEECGMKSPMGT